MTNLTPTDHRWWKKILSFVDQHFSIFVAAILITSTQLIFVKYVSYSRDSRDVTDIGTVYRIPPPPPVAIATNRHTVKVFTAFHDGRKDEIEKMKVFVSSRSWKLVSMNAVQQKMFLVENGKQCYDSFDSGERNIVLEIFNKHISLDENQLGTAEELWKYCTLYIEILKGSEAAAYLDSSSAIISTMEDTFDNTKNYAVLGDSNIFPGNALVPLLLIVQKTKSTVLKDMIKTIIEKTNLIKDEPVFLSMKFYEYVDNSDIDTWIILQQNCHLNYFRKEFESRERGIAMINQTLYSCQMPNEFCCDVTVLEKSAFPSRNIVMLTSHLIFPRQKLPDTSALSIPYIYHTNNHNLSINTENFYFISTIHEDFALSNTQKKNTPNFYELLLQKNCLPAETGCIINNMNEPKCSKKNCGCLCDAICNLKVPKKIVRKVFYATPPMFRKDPTRIIPRIIHQTYFESITRNKHPNLSRLVESWKQSGWEYRFYEDKDAREFILHHFPPEVLDTFDTLVPGAFKADLFRYCVLFVHGGIYADVDVLLLVNLDIAVRSDIGFMAPFDNPGTSTGNRMCLWNGFLAAAPGHPFLLKVIETIVNSVRNRFTSLDTINTMCPDPDFTVSYNFNMLFTSGPCILGASVNRVLGRHPQTQFEPGDLLISNKTNNIPGRTTIIFQGKNDMGAQRFTFKEKNLLIASTDMLDLKEGQNKELKAHHYSELHRNGQMYGVSGLYTSGKKANEDIQFLFRNV